jgi:serine/threonine-protein kinase RsbT
MEQSTQSGERELVKLPVTKMHDVLLARFVGREEAAKLGFPPVELTRIATAISEITRNVVQHAQAPGRFALYLVQRDGRIGLRIVVQDDGCGMDDIDRKLSGAGLAPGSGIPGSRRLMNEFEISSRPGSGTTVTMLHWV